MKTRSQFFTEQREAKKYRVCEEEEEVVVKKEVEEQPAKEVKSPVNNMSAEEAEAIRNRFCEGHMNHVRVLADDVFISNGLRGMNGVIKFRVTPEQVPLYRLWKQTKALPKAPIIEMMEDGYGVVMEKLVPFVYQKEREPEYYAAIEEVFRVSNYKNMNICPRNFMMRANGEIVFISLWNNKLHPAYTTNRNKDTAASIRESMARCLFHFRQRETFLKVCLSTLKEISKLAHPTTDIYEAVTSNIPLYEDIKEQDYQLDDLYEMKTVLLRLNTAKEWFKKNKSSIAMYVVIDNDSKMPKFDSYLNDHLLCVYADKKEVLIEVGATEEEATRFTEM